MSQYKPGEGGRPPGAQNKVTGLQREFIQSLLDDEQEKIKFELSELHGKEYLNVVHGLLEFILPKLARTEIRGEVAAIQQITGMTIL